MPRIHSSGSRGEPHTMTDSETWKRAEDLYHAALEQEEERRRLPGTGVRRGRDAAAGGEVASGIRPDCQALPGVASGRSGHTGTEVRGCWRRAAPVALRDRVPASVRGDGRGLPVRRTCSTSASAPPPRTSLRPSARSSASPSAARVGARRRAGTERIAQRHARAPWGGPVRLARARARSGVSRQPRQTSHRRPSPRARSAPHPRSAARGADECVTIPRGRPAADPIPYSSFRAPGRTGEADPASTPSSGAAACRLGSAGRCSGAEED